MSIIAFAAGVFFLQQQAALAGLIDALLGLWSPRPGTRTADGAPGRNTELKEFLLGRLSR